MAKYNLDDILSITENDTSMHAWQDKMAIQQVHSSHIVRQESAGGYSTYSLLLVLNGKLEVEYSGKNMEFSGGDLYFYAPGMPTKMIGASPEYQAYLFMIDEKTVVKNPMLSLFLKAAYIPVAELSCPKISLTKQQIVQLTTLFTSLIQHISLPTTSQEETLFRLCELISLDVVSYLQQNISDRKITSRMEEIFARFLQLVPKHAVHHHDIAYYADRLNITTTYLSRIVRKMSGRTVMSFLEYAIMNEAIRLLKNTDRSITDIAFDLSFSDQSSFTKFFTRLKGVSPLQFRKR
jgi:AraC-like DNA-binding protein